MMAAHFGSTTGSGGGGVPPDREKIINAVLEVVISSLPHVDNRSSYNPALEAHIDIARPASDREEVHTLTVTELRVLCGSLAGGTSLGNQLALSAISRSCHCGEASTYTSGLLSIMDDGPYHSAFAGSDAYLVQNLKDEAHHGVDHCYVGLVQQGKDLNTLIHEGLIIDSWMGQLYPKAMPGLHYVANNDQPLLTQQSACVKLRTTGQQSCVDMLGDIDPLISGFVIESLEYDSASVTETWADCTLERRKARDDQMFNLLQKIYNKLGDTHEKDDPEVDARSIAQLEAWTENVVHRLPHKKHSSDEESPVTKDMRKVLEQWGKIKAELEQHDDKIFKKLNQVKGDAEQLKNFLRTERKGGVLLTNSHTLVALQYVADNIQRSDNFKAALSWLDRWAVVLLLKASNGDSGPEDTHETFSKYKAVWEAIAKKVNEMPGSTAKANCMQTLLERQNLMINIQKTANLRYLSTAKARSTPWETLDPKVFIGQLVNDVKAGRMKNKDALELAHHTDENVQKRGGRNPGLADGLSRELQSMELSLLTGGNPQGHSVPGPALIPSFSSFRPAPAQPTVPPLPPLQGAEDGPAPMDTSSSEGGPRRRDRP